LTSSTVKNSIDIHWIPYYDKRMTPEDLKTWRKQHGHTQQSLADALGVIKLTVGRWETGARHIPSFLHLALDALECKGGEKKPRDTETKKEVTNHGKHLPKR
jgi:transcriptional regulator with XRE-family HTH domain